MRIEPIYFGAILGITVGFVIAAWQQLSQEKDVVVFPSVSYDELDIDKDRRLDQRDLEDIFKLSVEKKAPDPVEYHDFETLNIYVQVAKIGLVLTVLFGCLYLSWQILTFLSTEMRNLFSVGVFVVIALFVSTLVKKVAMAALHRTNDYIGSSLTHFSVRGTGFENPKDDLLMAASSLTLSMVVFGLSFLTPTILGAKSVQEVFNSPLKFGNVISTVLLEFVRGSGYLFSIGLFAMGIVLLRPYFNVYWRF